VWRDGRDDGCEKTVAITWEIQEALADLQQGERLCLARDGIGTEVLD
jgi:hypothetical protein